MMWTKPFSSVIVHSAVPYKSDTTWTQMWFEVRASDFPEHDECTEGGTRECSPTGVKKRKKKQEIKIRLGVKRLHGKDFYFFLNNLLSYWVTCTAGAAERASVKHIMHMSSASCFRQPVLLSQPCRHGRQVSSFLTPPQGCPQGWVLLQACFAYSWMRNGGNWYSLLQQNLIDHITLYYVQCLC